MFGKNKKNNSLDEQFIKAYNKIREKSKRKLLCHAPFSTLFFSEYGEILPCYYNKNIVFGRYPEQSPEEAWFGKKMSTLREHIKNNDLSYGCQDCMQYLNSENYYSVGAWKYDYLPVNKSKYPISLDFQISNICNLSCIMCNGEYSQTVRQKRENKDSYVNPYDENFIKKIEPFIPHLKEAAFTGGETFIIKQYYDIWDKILEINPKIRISITTNGTILNSKIKTYLDKLNFNITMSLDSISKENFESIRRLSNFDNVLNNLDYYIEYTKRKQTLLTVKVCPMRQNWHEMPVLINFLNNKNVLFLFNNVVFPPYCSLWNLPSAKLKEVYEFIEKHEFATNTIIQKGNIERVDNLINQLKNWEKQAKEFENTYPDINSKSANEINILLKQKIRYYLTTNTNISASTSFGQDLEKVFDDLIISIKDEKILKNAFIYFFKIPVHRILSEFNIRNFDKIVERTIQAGYTEPPSIK